VAEVSLTVGVDEWIQKINGEEESAIVCEHQINVSLRSTRP
jgi:hypothetical protein